VADKQSVKSNTDNINKTKKIKHETKKWEKENKRKIKKKKRKKEIETNPTFKNKSISHPI